MAELNSECVKFIEEMRDLKSAIATAEAEIASITEERALAEEFHGKKSAKLDAQHDLIQMKRDEVEFYANWMQESVDEIRRLRTTPDAEIA